MGYIDLKYRPGKDDLVCEFRVEPAAGVTMKQAAEAVAGESSVGTWTDITTSKPYIKKLGAKVFEMRGSYIKVAYPEELFELDNIPQILSSVAGNIFGMKMLRNLRLEDINFPDKVIRSFKGPRFGIQGIRKLLKVKDRPLVGTIVKPKIGLRTADHARVAQDAWEGGCDIVKDDENLSGQSFNPFEKRVKVTLKARDAAEKVTGERKMYMPNVTAETNEMLRRARLVKDSGGEYVMVDIMTTGWSALHTLRDLDLDVVLHGHRAMHAALTRSPKHGISMLTIAKLSRLIGVDQLHIGTIIGKMEGSKDDVQEIEQQIEKRIIRPHSDTHALGEEWMSIKPVFAVCSGGLHPGHVPKLMGMMGRDIIIQMGGGIHGNPLGTKAGAAAARQAVQASMDGQQLEKYALKHKELAAAMKKWA
ncbi:MAG: type III ribulose-bisphosphate carboxylase [Candidatus Aenigmatarchaeota archaeon]|nr:MAG: type III ribulose-bisphosphate carboxylase [Candidatus Aenigmarchaeota archaeon]